MKMIWAVLRSEFVQPVIDALRRAGISGLTRVDVTRYGRSPAVPEGADLNTDMLTEMIMIVLPDNDVAKAVIAIRTAAKARAKMDPEKFPDDGTGINGRIFVTYVEDVYTIRTALKKTGLLVHEKNYCDHPE